MKLLEDVTFDSLGAVRQELHEWFAPRNATKNRHRAHSASRDLLVSVLIHRLADELSDVNLRSQIHRCLSDLPQSPDDNLAS